MEERKKVFLERQWNLLDGNKALRARIPTICCSLIIAISGFYFHGDNYSKLNRAWLLFVIFDLLIVIAGLVALGFVHQQYNYSNQKVEKLYSHFDMEFLKGTKQKSQESGKALFIVGYGFIAFFGIVSMIAKSWIAQSC